MTSRNWLGVPTTGPGDAGTISVPWICQRPRGEDEDTVYDRERERGRA